MDKAEDTVCLEQSIDDLVFVNDFSADDFVNISDDKLNLGDSSLEIDGEVESSGEGIRPERERSRNYEDINTFVQKDKLMREIQDAGTIHGLNNYINKSMAVWESKKMNVAVTGNSGVGKSSLINALRGVKPNSAGAAKVGIKETTIEIRKYDYPETDQVMLWDSPGVGTQRFAKETYLEDVELSKFDIVVVVTANRFLENDIWLANQALGLGMKVLFVRTKIDLDLLNAQRDDPDDFDEAKCLQTIRGDIEENVRKGGIARTIEQIYLVCSPDRTKYDFTLLSGKLQRLMNTKGNDICKQLLTHLEKALEEKRDAIKCQFNGKKAASAVFGFLPIPTLETALGALTIRKIREVCLRAFNLDDESLRKVSKELHIPVEVLKEYHLLSFNTEQLNNDKRLYSETEENRYCKFRRYSQFIVPILGGALSAFKCPTIIQECLDIICSVMSDDEFHLVQLRLRLLERQLRPLKHYVDI